MTIKACLRLFTISLLQYNILNVIRYTYIKLITMQFHRIEIVELQTNSNKIMVFVYSSVSS